MKKNYLLLTLAGLVLLGACQNKSYSTNESPVEKISQSSTQETAEETSQTRAEQGTSQALPPSEAASSSSEEAEEYDQNYYDAVSVLEGGERLTGAPVEQVNKTLHLIEENNAKLPIGAQLENINENGLGMSDIGMSNILGVVLIYGKYKVNYERTEVYGTEYNDVYQVLFVLESPEHETMYWVANYNNYASQFKLARNFGGTLHYPLG